MNSLLLKSVSRMQNKLNDTAITDDVGACITLTTNANFSITTAGTNVVWNTATNQYQITYTTDRVFIPSSGFYGIFFSSQTSSQLSDLVITLQVNNVNTIQQNVIGSSLRTRFSASFMRYFTSGDYFRIRCTPNINTNLLQQNFGTGGEGPILHVAQITGAVGL